MTVQLRAVDKFVEWMMGYTDADRKEDFGFFLEQYDELYEKYGQCFVVIKNKKILGVFHTEEAIDIISHRGS